MLTVIIILFIVLAISLYSEIHALGIWVLLMITHPFVADSLGSSAVHLPMVAGLIIVATIIVRKKWTGVPANILLMVISLFVLMTMAAILGLDPDKSLEMMLRYSKGIALAILVAGTIKSDFQIRQLTQYCLVGVLIGVCLSFFEYFTGEYGFVHFNFQRASRFSGDPNDTAMLLLTGIPLALYWATHSKRLSITIACFGFIGLIIGAITMTQSRGGAVALLLILSFLYLRKPSIKASAIGLAILAAGLLFAPADYWDRMETLVGLEEEQDTSLDLRKDFIKAGVIIVLDDPALGVGMGNFGKAMVAADPMFSALDPNSVAHNMYLEFFAENGIIAGLLFVGLLGIAVLQSIRHDKRSKSEYSVYGLGFCVATSLLAMMTSGLFLSQGKHSVLWFLIGLGIAFQVMARSRKQPPVTRYTNKLVDY